MSVAPYGMDPTRAALGRRTLAHETTPLRARILAAIRENPDLSQVQLAKRLGCASSYVNRIAVEMGIRRAARRSRELEATVLRLWLENATDDQIAQETGHTRRQIEWLRWRMGLNRKTWTRLDWTEDRVARLAELVREDLDDKSIAATLQREYGVRVSPHAVSTQRRERRLLRKGGSGDALRRARQEVRTLEAHVERLERENNDLRDELAALRASGPRRLTA